MNVLIAEDEVLASERLQELLRVCDPKAKVIDRLESVEELVNFFKSGKEVDLLLLDIQLADGKSFEIFEKVSIDVPIIFTTAFDQYALEAFKFLSVDYLLKPVQSDDLSKALLKFHRLSKSKSLGQDEIAMLKNILTRRTNDYKERLLIKAGNKLAYKRIEDVAYFFADGKSVYLVSQTENRKFLIDYTLEDLETKVNSKNFYRINRKFIINISSIREVKGLLGSRLELKLNQQCDQELHVSRDRVSEFKRWLDQ